MCANEVGVSSHIMDAVLGALVKMCKSFLRVAVLGARTVALGVQVAHLQKRGAYAEAGMKVCDVTPRRFACAKS